MYWPWAHIWALGPYLRPGPIYGPSVGFCSPYTPIRRDIRFSKNVQKMKGHEMIPPSGQKHVLTPRFYIASQVHLHGYDEHMHYIGKMTKSKKSF